jgi:hypothetical protein
MMLKAVRVWWMYWRYRNITQRRQRLQMSWSRRKRPSLRSMNSFNRSPASRYRPRGSAVPIRAGTRRSWVPILLMVVALALISTYGYKTNLNNDVLRALGALVIVGGVYSAMRIA